jgi:hypothetical protein
MAAAKRRIDIIVTEKEFEALEQYCKDNGQTKTAVMRELIRTLGAHTAEDSSGIALRRLKPRQARPHV